MPSFPSILVSSVALLVALSSAAASADTPDFQREVRPILSDHCYACHGPDEGQRQADLRLDTAEGMETVVQPGDLDSELVLRLETDDPDAIMPPPDFHKDLSATQRQVLKDWVAAGGEFETHWAFNPPVRSDVVADDVSPIDYFLNRQIKRRGLSPNEPADRRTLLRRLCLDLTGLPPTRQQLDQFLADQKPGAYGRLVDRLLASSQYGEHMARYWLDIVRYADTHGLHLDNYREMWPFRDWVIKAFNENISFDQFITYQLAGDLLPNATQDQIVASGYNRLNVTTNEGGSIYDEVFARNVIDRTDAFGTVFLGMTAGCAVCHDHKFDPLTVRDYYSLSAFFNSLDGRAMDGNVKDHAPVLSVANDQQSEKLREYDAALADVQTEIAGPIESVDAAQQAWEQSLVQSQPPVIAKLIPTEVTSSASVEMKVDDDGVIEIVDKPADKDTTTVIATLPQGAAWQTIRLEAVTKSPDERVGLSENGNVVLTEFTVAVSDSEGDDAWRQIPIRYAVADIEQADGPFAVSYAIDEKTDEREGWAVGGHQQTGPRNAWFVMPALQSETKAGTRIRIQLKYESIYQAHQFRRIRFSLSDTGPAVRDDQRITLGSLHTAGPFPLEAPRFGYNRDYASLKREFKADEVFTHTDRPYRWHHRADLPQVEVSRLAIIDGKSSVTVLHQSIQSPKAQKLTLLIGTDDGHTVFLNGKQLGTVRGPRAHTPLADRYELDLKKGDNRLYIKVINHSGSSELSYAFRAPAMDVPRRLIELLTGSQPSDADRQSIRSYYRKVYCLHPDWLALQDYEKGLVAARTKTKSEIPTTLIWKELDKPRQAHILKRGQYDQPGDAVPRATPAFLPPMPDDAPADRLGLARWLVSPQHPLTARVAVNRIWQQVFGIGLVRTGEDFGSQGEPPSHRQLLDWLAVDFRENGWDVKRLIRMIVTSDAYRRSPRVTDAMLEIDPENRLLARGPRFRLDAEVIRDQALALSGLLNDQHGGPGVKPPQPDGLWAAVGYTRSNTARFIADSGDKTYRRSVYIFWKRTSAPPQMSTLDAPSRESCTVRRERTNTPLQALLLLNETQLFQAAKHLARRTLENAELKDAGGRVAWLLETVTLRPPAEAETAELVDLASDLVEHYTGDIEAAKLIDETGSAELAAWTIVASAMLNLDEVVTK